MDHSLHIKLKSGLKRRLAKKWMFAAALIISSFNFSYGNSPDTFSDIQSILTAKSTAASGNWNTASNWSPTGVPAYGDNATVNHAMTVDVSLNIGTGSSYIINKTLTDAGTNGINMSGTGAIDFNANGTFNGGLNMSNNTSLIVRSGYTLTIGSLSISNFSSITVEQGGKLIINGDVNASNSVPIQDDGTIQINGNFRSSNSVAVTGNGNFLTTQQMITNNSATIFGSAADCTTGPCSGRTLCSFTNSLSTTTPTIVCGGTPPTIVGTSNASSPTIQWQASTTSSSASFSTVANSGANYTPASQTTKTWYKKTITASGCTSDAIQMVDIDPSTTSWTGGTGNWSTSSNWCGGLPTSTTDVVVNSGALTIDITTAKCRNITITSPGTVALSGSNALSVYGNWTGSSNFTQTGGTVTLVGSSAQTINGVNSFKNLTIANTSGGVSIPSGSNMQTITGALTLTSGIVTTNGNLTIDFGSGGAIAGTGTGSISGNLTTTRAATSGWHYLGAPIDNLTYASFNSAVTINSGNFYTYQESVVDQNIADGWHSRTEAMTTSLSGQKETGEPSAMIGYALGSKVSTTFSFTGSYTHGKTYTTGNMSYTSSGSSSADGWHLIANPYPSYVDWSSSTGWTKTNISSTITYYNPANGMNLTYTPAQGATAEQYTNGASPYIPPMQAFWVQTTANNAVVSINNNARVINPSVSTYGASSFYRMGSTDEKSIKIAVKNSFIADETVLRFASVATEDYDSDFDAIKSKNDLPNPNIYTVDVKNEYAINTLPAFQTSRKFHLNFEPGSTGTFTLSASQMKNLPAGTVVMLEDTHLEVFHNLSLGAYTFSAEDGDEKGRFILSFETVETAESIQSSNAPTVTATVEATGSAGIDIVGNQHDVKIFFYNTNDDNAEVFIYNMAGHEIYSNHHASISSGLIDISLNNSYSGVYVVKVITDNMTHSEKIHL